MEVSELSSAKKRMDLSALFENPAYLNKIEVTSGQMHKRHSSSFVCSFEYKPNLVQAVVKLETIGGEILNIPLTVVDQVVMESNKVTIKGSSYDIFA
jgi:hypothetical protein